MTTPRRTDVLKVKQACRRICEGVLKVKQACSRICEDALRVEQACRRICEGVLGVEQALLTNVTEILDRSAPHIRNCSLTIETDRPVQQLGSSSQRSLALKAVRELTKENRNYSDMSTTPRP